ncbi:MAG: HK97 gp10 family phage protein [Ktedonobacterales bacterium]|nr:HK97 gp10 family phage protein [Ktedonobacterales bacterium]
MGLLRDSLYKLEFSPEALMRIGRLINTGPTFARFYTAAMREAVNLVQHRAQANAPVLTGALRRGIRGYVRSPWLGEVGVISSIPYAMRREFGFDGLTDSLGRTYAAGDPLYTNPDKRSHMQYLHRALHDSQPEVNALWRTATRLAVREVIL